MSLDSTERKVWLITGASSGFGRTLTEAALERGHQVVATARNVMALQDLVDGAPGRVHAVSLELTDRATISAAVAAATEMAGRIDVLVNNAGYGLLGAVEDLDDEDLRLSYETNLFGPLCLVRAVLPGMRCQRSGHIVQMSSMVAVSSGLGGSAYAGPKAALEVASEALAAEVKPWGIGVTIVEPGAFRTDFSGRSLRSPAVSETYSAIVGPPVRAFRASHGTQRGDPRLGAEAIIAAIDCGNPPLRLPLGPDAFDGLTDYLQTRLGELQAVRPLAADTDFR
jgi:NAD(P)-dependent dehydrogenase (short-subunit alcohol dehydrogenase family)